MTNQVNLDMIKRFDVAFTNQSYLLDPECLNVTKSSWRNGPVVVEGGGGL